MTGKGNKPDPGLPKFDSKKPVREQIKAAFDATYEATDDELDVARYGGDKAKARDAKVGEKRSRAVAGMRAAAILAAWDATPAAGAEPFTVGAVTFGRLLPFHDDGGQVIGVEVFLASSVDAPLPAWAEAHFRIINPPTLVADGAGTVTVSGRRYREDPLVAVAQAIVSVRKGRETR